MIIVWSPRAIEHLAHLRSYIARNNPKAANRVATALLDAVERLAVLPSLDRPGRVVGARKLVVPSTPYVIPYRLRGDRLEVIAVFHGRQKWAQAFVNKSTAALASTRSRLKADRDPANKRCSAAGLAPYELLQDRKIGL